MRSNFDELNSHSLDQQDRGLSRVAKRLAQSLERDALVQKTTDELRQMLQADRVVLYYFYQRWKGQVTFESLSAEQLSILGSTGADDCFNDEYAALYLDGRVRAIADIETEPIQECHRDFLRSLQVRANLVVPVLTSKGLWGLLIAHHCQAPHQWSAEEIKRMQQSATRLATAPAIRDT
ncbi:GAF domain-containing protein [Trichocoleus sp. FACHB-591]|uniref:GAF domain-containing protein n=1 Tax=Trichocoleus sp. FACHB-591 TaxID=2692872 RepID=UPI0016822D0C|nr:GAF domain-containing protein [Trichocoleus sp. FACHB-591]